MDLGQLEDLAHNASIMISDENNRTAHPSTVQEISWPENRGPVNSQNLEGLKKRHPFLNEYSDSTLSSISLDTLLKLESTSIKLKSLEKMRATEEKLAANRDALMVTEISVRGEWTKDSQFFMRVGFFQEWAARLQRCGRGGGNT